MDMMCIDSEDMSFGAVQRTKRAHRKTKVASVSRSVVFWSNELIVPMCSIHFCVGAAGYYCRYTLGN